MAYRWRHVGEEALDHGLEPLHLLTPEPQLELQLEYPAPQTRHLFVFIGWEIVYGVPLAFSGGLLIPPVLFAPFPPLALLRGLLHLVDLAFSARRRGRGLLGARC